jgi:phosphate/sulfate permease
MTTAKTYTDLGAPFDALALYALLAIGLIVANGVVLDVWQEPGGAAFFFIGSAIVAISIYPVIALFVVEPWRVVVAIVSGLIGAGIYVCVLDAYYQGQDDLVWNLEYYWKISIFYFLAVVPAIFSAGTLILVGHNFEKIPLTIVCFGTVPSDSFFWRLSEAYRRKAVRRRCEELAREEQHLRAETAIEQALMERRLARAREKYLDSLTERERATLQLRMEAMARADARAARDTERLETENTELRQTVTRLQKALATAGIRATA